MILLMIHRLPIWILHTEAALALMPLGESNESGPFAPRVHMHQQYKTRTWETSLARSRAVARPIILIAHLQAILGPLTITILYAECAEGSQKSSVYRGYKPFKYSDVKDPIISAPRRPPQMPCLQGGVISNAHLS